jgi:hypothetical protein
VKFSQYLVEFFYINIVHIIICFFTKLLFSILSDSIRQLVLL